MRLLVIHCSPRKDGFGARYLAEAVTGFKETHSDAEIIPVHINDLSVKGCQHCGACKATEQDVPCCIYEDDLKEVFYKMLHCDAVLWSVPNYMGNYNAQAKLVIDRFYGFSRADGNTRLPLSQKTGLIIVQGNPDEDLYRNVEDDMKRILSRRGERQVYAVTIGGCRGLAADATSENLARARALGQELAKG